MAYYYVTDTMPIRAEVEEGYVRCPACQQYSVVRHARREEQLIGYVNASGEVNSEHPVGECEETAVWWQCEDCDAQFLECAFTFEEPPA